MSEVSTTPRPDTSDRPVWDEGVKALRGLHGLTVRQLAEQADVTESTITELENGSRRITLNKLESIARVLEADPLALFPVRTNLPPIECAPWCEDGAGHGDRTSPEDQYCSALYLELELARDPVQVAEDGPYFRRTANLNLERDPFGEPYVSAYIQNGNLTLDEAEEIGKRMLEQVELARGRD